jgi:hypothetical protein
MPEKAPSVCSLFVRLHHFDNAMHECQGGLTENESGLTYTRETTEEILLKKILPPNFKAQKKRRAMAAFKRPAAQSKAAATAPPS